MCPAIRWFAAAIVAAAAARSQDPAVAVTREHAAATLLRYTGERGPLHGKRIVLVAGDDEYRSEQSLPQLARILAFRLGAECQVRLPIDANTSAIDPGAVDNIPGLDALATADLLVLFLRFRALPDAQMQCLVDYVEAGKPIVALRTSTHAFALPKDAKFAAWSWDAESGGFGRRVLGETWIAHHGQHGAQGTRGVVADGAADHPILRGVAAAEVFDPADVYRVRQPLPDGCAPLLLGSVLATMAADAAPVPDQGPLMPIAWTREWPSPAGRTRVFTTTLGSAQAFAHAPVRRLLVNACLWALRMDTAITPDLDVALVGDYAPREFGFGKFERGVLPASLAWPPIRERAEK